MTKQELKRIFQSENCLSLDTIKLYKQGKLAARNSYVVERHLLACSLCAEAFDSLDTKRMAEVDKVAARVNKRLATYMNTPPRIGFFQRFGFAITAGILLLAGGGGVAWWLNNDDQHKTDTLTGPAPVAVFSPASGGSAPVYTTSNTREPSVPQVTQDNPVVNNPGTPIAADTKNGSDEKVADARNAKPATTQPISTAVTTTTNPGSTGNTVPTAQTTTTAPGGDNNSRTPSAHPLEVVSSRITMKLSADANDGRAVSGNIDDGQFTRSNKKKKHEQTLDQMPQFPSGDWNLESYVMRNFKPLKIDRDNIKNYTAMAIVTVSSKGSVTKVEVMRGINKDVDAEIVRVLQNMPPWSPGKGDIDATVVVTVE